MGGCGNSANWSNSSSRRKYWHLTCGTCRGCWRRGTTFYPRPESRPSLLRLDGVRLVFYPRVSVVTDSDCLSGRTPRTMFPALQDLVSERKTRLYACACVRVLW